MNNLTEEEIQALIISIELADPVETPNNSHYSFYPKSINEAKKYFFGYSLTITHKTKKQLRLMQYFDIHRILKKNGILVFITSEKIDIENNLINYFKYEKYDYTEDCFNIMKLKNKIMKKYEKDFEKESNSFIWKQYMDESITESVKEIPEDFSRFIYKAVKKS